MTIREYKPDDCKEITELFFNTVHTVNAKDYSKEQLDVWAPEIPDFEKWNKSLKKNYCIVALDGTTITGFGDIDSTGYLDHLFVHKDYQRGYIVVKQQQVERHGIFLTNFVMEKAHK